MRTSAENLETLRQRRKWMKARIAAKQSIEWETEWDERELEALEWAIGRLEG